MNFESTISRSSDAFDYQADDTAARASKRRWIIIAVVAVIVAAIIAAVMFGSGDKAAGGAAGGKDAAKQAARVTVISPGRSQVTNAISATGTLAARREMPVSVVGEGGLVSRVWVEPGDWVKKGQVLVSIERSVQDQQANQLAAQVTVAQADARIAQTELDRSAALVERGFISKADLDRKAATRDAARARVAVAVAQLNEGRNRNGRLEVRAPAYGLVLSRAVEPGQVIGAGSAPLFRLAAGGEMELKAQMAEADLARMSVGFRATVTPVGTTDQFAGQIWQVAPIIDPQSRQGIARIAVPYNRALRPGGFASAQITAGQVDAPLLPETAVQRDAKGSFVLIVGSNNKIERRDVQIGNVTNAGATVLTGLAGNERVVLSAGAFLNPGEVVEPVKQLVKR
jgi:HlyD family secretion protein